jgi:cysteine-rich repeat protein
MSTSVSRLTRTGLATLLLVTVSTSPALAWLTVEDQGESRYDQVRAIALDAAGNVVVAGMTEGAPGHVVQYDTNGSRVWHTVLPGGIRSQSLVVEASGDAFVAMGNRIVRLAATDGSTVWQVTQPPTEYAKTELLAADASGDLIGAGAVGQVVKLDPADGSEVWASNGSSNQPSALAVDPITGDAFVAGCTAGPTCESSFAGADRVSRLRGSDGALLWQSADLGGPIRELAVTPAGDVITAGRDVFKLAGASGAVLWTAEDLRGASVAVDAAGNAYVGGVFTGSFNFAVDFVVTKLATASGAVLWQAVVDPSIPFGTSGTVHDLALDGGAVVAVGALEGQLAVVKLDAASGALTWKRVVTSTRTSSNHLASVAVAGGNVHAGGTLRSAPPDGDDFAVLQLSAAGAGVSYCGDGAATSPEQCDDGNETPDDGCEPDCTTTLCGSGLVISNAELVSSNLYQSNPERMRFKGVLPFAVGAGQAYEPHLDGAQVRIRRLPYGDVITLDSSATPIPPQSAGVCLAQRDGWKATPRKATYRNKSNAIDPPACTEGSAQGLQQLSFSLKPSTGTTTVQLSAAGEAAGSGPVEVIIGADTTTSGCARVIFAPEDCQVVGRTSAQVSRVRCRN